MRENVYASVASTKECAQNPADDADDNRAPERAPKTIHVESHHDARDHQKHEAIHDQDEKPQGHQNKRYAEDQQNRADKRVEDPEQKRGAYQGGDGVITNTVNDRRRDHDGNRRCDPAENEMSHNPAFNLPLSYKTARNHLPTSRRTINELKSFNDKICAEKK
jgi:hypothetical protein